jgi:hypothetical protein
MLEGNENIDETFYLDVPLSSINDAALVRIWMNDYTDLGLDDMIS